MLPGAELLAILEKYLKSLRQPLIGADEISSHIELGQKLYRELVGPAEELIRQKKHIIVAADGPLHYLPFETLIVSQGKSLSQRATRLTDVNYLLKQYQITYVPSASVLVAQQSGQQPKMPKAEIPILAFGDPVYNEASNSQSSDVPKGKITNLALRGQTLNRLEFSGDEVRRIARVWGVSPDSTADLPPRKGFDTDAAECRSLAISYSSFCGSCCIGRSGQELSRNLPLSYLNHREPIQKKGYCRCPTLSS